MTTEIATQSEKFELLQREASAVLKSDLIPVSFKNSLPNCMIAVGLAKNIGVDVFTIMQNLHPIHGRMSWASTFIISALNSCGRFSPIRYDLQGEGKEMSCRAMSTDLITGDVLKGPKVTMAMAMAEGWVSKKGSKWVTMPELMIQYRSAAFFGRLYAPDIFNGMHLDGEVQDFAGPPRDVTPNSGNSAILTTLNQLAPKEVPPENEATEPEEESFLKE